MGEKTEKTTLDLEAAERLANAATPGPWKQESWLAIFRIMLAHDAKDNLNAAAMLMDDPDHFFAADAAFISASRELIPSLIAEVRRLRAVLTEIKKMKPEPIGDTGFQTGHWRCFKRVSALRHLLSQIRRRRDDIL